MGEASASARAHPPCSGALLCRRCAAAYFGRSPDWFDDHVRDEVPAVVVEGRAVGLRLTDLNRWLRLHTEGAWDDAHEPLSPSTGVRTANAGGSNSSSRARGTGSQLRAPIGERLPNGRRPSGRKQKRGQGNPLSLVPSHAISGESQTISSSASEA